MICSILLAGWLAAPSYNVRPDLNNGQVRRKAHHLVQLLRRQDPRVLRSVMYFMGWVPKLEHTRGTCKKELDKKPSNRYNTIEDPIMNMLRDTAGFPKPSSGPRSR